MTRQPLAFLLCMLGLVCVDGLDIQGFRDHQYNVDHLDLTPLLVGFPTSPPVYLEEDHTLYVHTTRGYTQCLNTTTQELLWSSPPYVKGELSLASPLVQGEFLYTSISALRKDPQLVKLNRFTGERVWTHVFPLYHPHGSIQTTPLVHEGMICAASQSLMHLWIPNPGAPCPRATVACIKETKEGEMPFLWTFHPVPEGRCGGHVLDRHLMLSADDTIVMSIGPYSDERGWHQEGTEAYPSSIVVLDASTGFMEMHIPGGWTKTLSREPYGYLPDPLIILDGRAIITQTELGIVEGIGIDGLTPRRWWRTSIGPTNDNPILHSASCTDGNRYFYILSYSDVVSSGWWTSLGELIWGVDRTSSYGYVGALDIASGNVLWKTPTLCQPQTTPIYHNAFVLFLCTLEHEDTKTLDVSLIIVDPAMGNIVYTYTHSIHSVEYRFPTVYTPVIAGNHVYVAFTSDDIPSHGVEISKHAEEVGMWVIRFQHKDTPVQHRAEL